MVVRDRITTYGELDHRARVLARAILHRAARPPERIGVFTYRSELAYSGTLAALYAGAAFVPLNKQFPIDRTAAMIEQADLDAIIVDSASQPSLVEAVSRTRIPPVIVVPDNGPALGLPKSQVCGPDEIATQAPLDRLAPVAADRPAYLLFTSGTTGRPKGVMLTHGNARSFLEAVSNRYQLTPEDRVSQTFDQTFDLSVFDMFVTWEAGACLCSLQNTDLLAPARFVNRHHLTTWFSVPSVVAYMQRAGQLKSASMPSLRWSLFCGEALPRKAAEAWAAAAPNAILENLYGPTELTIACSVYRWDAARSAGECHNDIVPIGKLFAGLEALILDADGAPAVNGEPGELCVGGAQTSPGYWRDPARTDERFFRRPGPDGSELPFYRTGDRVAVLPSGDLGYIGRTDFQVKVNGYRVELAEVEAVMLRDPAVHSAAVVGWPIEEGSVRGLVGFVLGNEVSIDALKEHLRAALPPYAVPREIIELTAFPLNANGKVDRNALVRQLAER